MVIDPSAAASPQMTMNPMLLSGVSNAFSGIFNGYLTQFWEITAYLLGVVSTGLGITLRIFVLNGRAERARFQELIRDRAIDWARETASAMASAHGLLRRMAHGVPPSVAEALDVQSAISAAIDQGRLYFPNHFGHEFPYWPHWANKPPARRGYRDPILDMLVVTHDELRLVMNWLEQAQHSQPGTTAYDLALQALRGAAVPAEKNVFEARSEFISEVQKWMGLRERGIGRYQRPVRKRRPTAIKWSDGIAKVVDEYERRAGQGTLWRERPCPRDEFVKKYRELNPGWPAKILRSAFSRPKAPHSRTVQ